MKRIHLGAALLALGGLATLPACSPAYTRTGYAAPAPANPALSSSLVSQVQTALQQQGYYKGNIDGVWGPQTQGAVQSFQQSQSLTATGQLDSPTLAALNLPATAAAPLSQSSTAPSTQPSQSSATTTPSDTNSTNAPATPGNAATSNAPGTTGQP